MENINFNSLDTLLSFLNPNLQSKDFNFNIELKNEYLVDELVITPILINEIDAKYLIDLDNYSVFDVLDENYLYELLENIKDILSKKVASVILHPYSYILSKFLKSFFVSPEFIINQYKQQPSIITYLKKYVMFQKNPEVYLKDLYHYDIIEDSPYINDLKLNNKSSYYDKDFLIKELKSKKILKITDEYLYGYIQVEEDLFNSNKSKPIINIYPNGIGLDDLSLTFSKLVEINYLNMGNKKETSVTMPILSIPTAKIIGNDIFNKTLIINGVNNILGFRLNYHLKSHNKKKLMLCRTNLNDIIYVDSNSILTKGITLLSFVDNNSIKR